MVVRSKRHKVKKSQDHERLAWAEAQVTKCRRTALKYFRSRSLRVERKADGSPVTAADRLIEEQLRGAIERAFPGELIVGEEFGGVAHRGSSFWTVDPIDGTRAFTRGLPSWGILLGRVEQGRAVLGVCDFPAVGTRLAVARGIAAYERTGTRTRRLRRARPVKKLSDAVIFHGGSHWWQSTRFEQGFARVMRACYLERAYGDCFGYLWVLRGHADVMMDYGVHVWDLVPFAALAGATGRVLTDCLGRPSFTSPGTIMAQPGLARIISRILSNRR